MPITKEKFSYDDTADIYNTDKINWEEGQGTLTCSKINWTEDVGLIGTWTPLLITARHMRPLIIKIRDRV